MKKPRLDKLVRSFVKEMKGDKQVIGTAFYVTPKDRDHYGCAWGTPNDIGVMLAIQIDFTLAQLEKDSGRQAAIEFAKGFSFALTGSKINEYYEEAFDEDE